MKPIGDIASKLVPQITLTDEEWAAKDKAVEEARRLDQVKAQREEQVRCIERLVEGGAPEIVAHGVYGPEFNPETEACSATDRFSHEDPRRIRVLAGGVGCGKTWAAVRWLGDYGKKRPMFMRASAFEAGGRYDRVLRERWQNCSALVLDDLGAEYKDGKGNLLADLDELIDVYVGRRARLVITTNMVVADFKKRYGERIASRLRENARWRSITAGDMRRPR